MPTRILSPRLPSMWRIYAILFSIISRGGWAQMVTPTISFHGARNAAVSITPAEALINIAFERQRTAAAVMRGTEAYYPKDSLSGLDASRAQAWLRSLPRTVIRGMQLDPYSELAIIAKRDALAEQQIAARLAMPGLSLDERAYTLYTAVRIFANADIPTRLKTAERYVTQLDALGIPAALWQFQARKPLVYAYYRLGRTADVARHGIQACRLVGQIPYVYREVFYSPDVSFLYGATVDALSGQPNGRAILRALNVQLLSWTLPSAELVAQDSILYLWQGKSWKSNMEHLVAMSERIGQPATPLIANYWINRGASRDSQMVAVTDGKIRVLEIGSFTCAPCMAAVSGLERLHQQYPDVEFNFLTATEGNWGNRMIEPRAEADQLAEHFLTVKHITFPIGIALCPRIPTEDGGAEVTVTMPTWRKDQYPQISKPTFYVLDGRGTIRRVIAGYDRNLERTLADIVAFLQREEPQSGHVAVQ